MSNQYPLENHLDWAPVANAAQLPNVSGAAVQTSRVVVGARCVTLDTTTLYVCATPTVGAAVWLPQSGVQSSRTISTTGPLSGGGDLSANRTLSINANGITDSLLRQSGALSVIGRSANSTGNVADISASMVGDVLRRVGTTLGFGPISDVMFTTSTRDPISTDTSFILGTTWLNTTKMRSWIYVAAGEWHCITDPGLIWEWDPNQGTSQLDLVDEAGFTRSTGTFAGSPTTPALIITSTSGVTGNMALTLVKTDQLPPSFWTARNTFCMFARFANQSAANTLAQLTVPLYYDSTHVQACEEGATAGSGSYRNNTISWAGSGGIFSSSVSLSSTNGVTRGRRFSFVLPTGSTGPQVTCGGVQDQIGSWYTPILAAPDVSWRGLTNPRVGWGNRAYANASTSVYIGSMQIRRSPVGGA